jgi:predicted kinase
MVFQFGTKNSYYKMLVEVRKIILTKGLPGSGKSTWAKKYIKDHANTKRVNRDDLRSMIDDGVWSDKNEKKIVSIRNGIIRGLVLGGADVIIDETNLSPKSVEALLEFLHEVEKEVPLKIEWKDFTDVPVEECIKRDLKRSASVGEAVIRRFYKQHLAPREEEEPELLTPNPDLQPCILIDVDGTLSKRGDRGIYDFEKSIDDDYYFQTRFLLELIADQNKWQNPIVPSLRLIVFSGREDKFQAVTEAWLKKSHIPYDEIHMRKTEDKRPDYIVKQELYDTIIKDKYNVFFVLDDRKQVIDMWKRNGLYVLGADGTHNY